MALLHRRLLAKPPPFQSLLIANRGEIATRISRAAVELGIESVGIFSFEDRYTQHRYKVDKAFHVGRGKGPIEAYLDIPDIIKTAKIAGAQAIHPGYGFLSENPNFAQACADAGIVFVGPTPQQLRTFGDKTQARNLARSVGVSIIPGTDKAVSTLQEAKTAIEGKDGVGYPLILKAAHGGGGRGMRIIRASEELTEGLARCQSEALAAFGNSEVFIERYIDNPRHIEVQMFGDGQGNAVHLYDRDCSIQRRHQKVVELAPALGLPAGVREKILADAVKLISSAKYRNAGTVEFLVDGEKYYFIEVNPRVQVEHTITEEITRIDIVQTQIKLAAGQTFEQVGLVQKNIAAKGFAIQCRVTTEDPTQGFSPAIGRIDVFRKPGGLGVRVDDGVGFAGAEITRHYDSLLIKIISYGNDREEAIQKMRRALHEMRIRGVATNKSFLLRVLEHDDFINNKGVTTKFIEQHPILLVPMRSDDRGTKLMRFIGNVVINGADENLGASGPCGSVEPVPPPLSKFKIDKTKIPKDNKDVLGGRSLMQIYKQDGAKAFAKAVRKVRKERGLMIMDTTWRDAHQSLLATRMRTKDILAIAPHTGVVLRNAYALENWGGATFDVALRFLKECPWQRLRQMKELVPDIPFQMLLRGANAVGYKSYPDNVVFEFCKVAVRNGMDVFRVFDSLNYIENMRLGCEAVGAGGGIVEAAICYTGDVCNPKGGRYTLDYYMKFGQQLVDIGAHCLAVKDMAGLLRPPAATLLIGALRKQFPDIPIHVHTHDTAGTGVASMIACAEAGADAVDCASDSMSGMTSQPSMGALVGGLRGTANDTAVDLIDALLLNDYWEDVRALYLPFESGQRSGSADVYDNEIPGGQYTNMLFQSKKLGLAGRWPQIKRAYAAANRLLGDIIKVTPSSKVVGDLAQFMVSNNLSEEDVIAKGDTLSFPSSIVEYFQGYLGIPPYGFPEPLRSKVVKSRKLPNGKTMFEGRPGAEMPPQDFAAARAELTKRYRDVSEEDLMSYLQYPKEFEEYMSSRELYGDLSILPTRNFVQGLRVGEELEVEIDHGKTLFVILKNIGDVDASGMRDVTFQLNGRPRTFRVKDLASSKKMGVKEVPKADPKILGQIGAPMPGTVVDVRVQVGQDVEKSQPLVILTAMKMETVVASPLTGRVKRLVIGKGDQVAGGDLLCEVSTV